MSDRITEWLEEGSLYVALLAAWIAMLGSLYFSEVAGYIPCKFCWYQRILMYPLTGILTVGLLRRDRHLPIYVLPFSVLGIGFATYHYLLQKTNLFAHLATCEVGVPCSGIWINWLGFITIPFLSLTAFLIITFTTIIAWQAGYPIEPEGDEDVEQRIGRPWIPVISIIAVVAVAFFILSYSNSTAAVEHATPATSDFSVLATGAQTTIDGTAIDDVAHTEGQQLYRATCTACHGTTGTGVANVGTALTASTLLQTGTETEILAYIRAGSAAGAADNHSGLTMPPSGGRPDLSDEAMLSVIRYLQTEIALK